jgi:hypothetical protein
MSAGSAPSPARQQVDDHVASGDWPDPNERPCHDCGHVWFAGERRHEYDVDQLERAPDDHEDVHVVCVLCHQQRQFERGEELPDLGSRPSGPWSH